MVHITGHAWPDLITGTAIALLFIHSGYQMLVSAWAEWGSAGPTPLTQENTLK